MEKIIAVICFIISINVGSSETMGNIYRALIEWRVQQNEQVSVYNEAISNIMSNFVPNELITCNDRNPLLMNCYIKNLTVA